VLAELTVDVALMAQVVANAVSTGTGAVKSPVLLIVPHDADHVTAWFVVNCICQSACNVAFDGVIVTWFVLVVTVTVVEAVCPLPLVAAAVTLQELAVAGAL